MRRIKMVGLLLTIVCMLSGVTASSSFALCTAVEVPGEGKYNNDECKGMKVANGNYTRIQGLGIFVEKNQWCFETEAAGDGNYNNANCTGNKVANSNYIRIKIVFSSNTTNTHGAQKTGVFFLEAGGAVLECSSTEGGWAILLGGKEAVEGIVDVATISKWNGCKAKSKEIKEAKPSIKECALDLGEVNDENKTARMSVATECTITTTVLFITCTIHILPEKESENVNFDLETNSLENSGENLLIKSEDSGITTTTSGTCPGVSGTKEGKLKATFTGEGLKGV